MMSRRCSVQDDPQIIGRASKFDRERRSSDSNFYFTNKHISKSHAVVYRRDGKVYLKDTGSTFGTVLNNVLIAVEEPHELKTGDVLALVVNRPAVVVQSWRADKSLPLNIPLNMVANPSVHIQFKVELEDDYVVLEELPPYLRSHIYQDVDCTQTPEYVEDEDECFPAAQEPEPSQEEVVSDDETPEEVKFVKEVVITQNDPEPIEEVASDKKNIEEPEGEQAAEPDVFKYDDPSSEENVGDETENENEEDELHYDSEEVDEKEDSRKAENDAENSDWSDEEVSNCSDCGDICDRCFRVDSQGQVVCVDCLSDSEEEFATEEEEERAEDVFAVEELEVQIDRCGGHEEVDAESASSDDFSCFVGEDVFSQDSASDIFESCSCSKKRTYEEADLETEVPEEETTPEQPLPKKPRQIVRSVLKELGKGAFYVAGTLAAVILYGKSLENP